MLAEAMRDKSKALNDAFRQFVQTFSAIIGGEIALRLSHGVEKMRPYKATFNYLIVLGAIVFIILIIENHRSWLGYRRKLHHIAGTDSAGQPLIGPPSNRADVVPVVYILVILVAAAMAIISAPFV